jgi:hypothetical protein
MVVALGHRHRLVTGKVVDLFDRDVEERLLRFDFFQSEPNRWKKRSMVISFESIGAWRWGRNQSNASWILGGRLRLNNVGVPLAVALIITHQEAVCGEVDGTLLEREILRLAICR